MGCVGSSFPVAFFKVRQQPQLYRMYAIHRQFIHDHVNSYKGFKQQREEKSKKKKDNKKASSNIIIQTSIINI